MFEQTSENSISKNLPKKYFPHDRFFKASMSNIVVARNFFEHKLPKPLKKIFNLQTLKVEPSNFVDAALNKSESDLLFSVTTNNNQTGYLYLLLEHQSTPDYWMPLRLFHYRARILENFRKAYPKAKKLPLIHATVVYTGETPYTEPTDFFELFEDPELAKALFFAPFSLYDLQEIDDDVLKAEAISGVFQFFMKHIHEREFLPFWEEALPLLQDLEKQGLLEYVKTICYYTAEKAQIPNKGRIFRDLNNHFSSDNVGGTMATLAEQWFSEGEEKGRLEGEAKGKAEVAERLLAEGVSPSLVSRVADLTEDEVRKICEKNSSAVMFD